MSEHSGPREGARGVFEGLKGKAKEALGRVTGDRRSVREGQAQQRKGAAQREVAEHEAKADRARGEAALHETDQRTNQ